MATASAQLLPVCLLSCVVGSGPAPRDNTGRNAQIHTYSWWPAKNVSTSKAGRHEPETRARISINLSRYMFSVRSGRQPRNGLRISLRSEPAEICTLTGGGHRRPRGRELSTPRGREALRPEPEFFGAGLGFRGRFVGPWPWVQQIPAPGPAGRTYKRGGWVPMRGCLSSGFFEMCPEVP